MTYTTARRVITIRRALVVGFVVVAGVYSLAKDPVDNLLAPRCKEMPPLPATVPAEVMAELGDLQQKGHLTCPPIPSGIEGLADHALWGSDGDDSLFVFAYDEAHPVGVQIAYGDQPVHARGGWPLPGLLPSGRPVYRNEAPVGSGVFVLHLGAPRPSDNSVDVRFQGPGIPAEGLTGRDFFTDMENVWKRVRGQPLTTESTIARLRFAIVPGRWADDTGVWVAPDLADAQGVASVTALATAAPPDPTPYRILAGSTLGTGVWVAGILTGTNPTLILNVPDDAGTVQRVAPLTSAVWRPRDGDKNVVSFAFPLLPRGQPVEALYYADRAAAEASPAEAPTDRWTLDIPAPEGAAGESSRP